MIAYHFVPENLVPGGQVEHRVREELRALEGAGHRPVLVRPGDVPELSGIETLSVRSKGPLGFFSSSSAKRLVLDAARRRRPDVLHAHAWGAVRTAQGLARELGVPLVADIVDAPARGKHDHELASLPERIVTPAASLVRQLAPPGAPAGKAAHLPGSLEPGDLPSAPAVPFRLPRDKELLIVFAPLAEGDPGPLLSALDAALSTHAELHLLIMGHPIGETFLRAVSEHRMVPRVTFGGLPPLEPAARLLESARACFFGLDDPGLVEPYALLALLCGRPLLALEGEEARSLLGKAPSFVASQDVAALSEGLAKTLAAPRRDGAEHDRRFGRAALAERLEALYRELGAGR